MREPTLAGAQLFHQKVRGGDDRLEFGRMQVAEASACALYTSIGVQSCPRLPIAVVTRTYDSRRGRFAYAAEAHTDGSRVWGRARDQRGLVGHRRSSAHEKTLWEEPGRGVCYPGGQEECDCHEWPTIHHRNLADAKMGGDHRRDGGAALRKRGSRACVGGRAWVRRPRVPPWLPRFWTFP